MKNKLIALAMTAFALVSCSDDSSAQAKGASSATSAKAVFKGSMCQFDQTLLERAGEASSLKKTTSDERFGENAQKRSFYVEDAESSVQLFVTGLVSACNKVISGVDVRVEDDTLYATVNYRPDAETNCLCSWVDLSFTVDREVFGDSVKTLVIGDEVFPLREPDAEAKDGFSQVN